MEIDERHCLKTKNPSDGDSFGVSASFPKEEHSSPRKQPLPQLSHHHGLSLSKESCEAAQHNGQKTFMGLCILWKIRVPPSGWLGCPGTGISMGKHRRKTKMAVVHYCKDFLAVWQTRKKIFLNTTLWLFLTDNFSVTLQEVSTLPLVCSLWLRHQQSNDGAGPQHEFFKIISLMT